MIKQWIAAFTILLCAGIAPAAYGAGQDILLIVRGDDIGMARAINEACLTSYRKGVEKSVELVVPGPWFMDAVRRLKEEPGLDVGVHLTLTSEWEDLKWRPITQAPSLVDANGYFYPMTGQSKDQTTVVSFLGARPKIDEVERELRAQIELAKRHLPNQVSHLSAHMGTATSSPELRELVQRLAKEYGLPLEAPGLRGVRWPGGADAAAREESLVKALEQLTAGRWLVIEHPGLDTPEMHGLGHKGNTDVAAARAAVTAAYTSPHVKEVIQRRGIKLISYAEMLRHPAAESQEDKP